MATDWSKRSAGQSDRLVKATDWSNGDRLVKAIGWSKRPTGQMATDWSKRPTGQTTRRPESRPRPARDAESGPARAGVWEIRGLAWPAYGLLRRRRARDGSEFRPIIINNNGWCGMDCRAAGALETGPNSDPRVRELEELLSIIIII